MLYLFLTAIGIAGVAVVYFYVKNTGRKEAEADQALADAVAKARLLEKMKTAEGRIEQQWETNRRKYKATDEPGPSKGVRFLLMFLIFVFIFACVRIVKEPVFVKIPYPAVDEENYLKARVDFFKIQDEALKNPDLFECFEKMQGYFTALNKAEALKNTYMENMKSAILIFNEYSPKELVEIDSQGAGK